MKLVLSKKYFFCPLTKCVYLDPVVCPDGHTYESKAILYYFDEQETNGKIVRKKNTQNNKFDIFVYSPTTNELMEPRITRDYNLEKMIKELKDKHDFIKDNLFELVKPYYLFKEEFKSSLKQDIFIDLVDYRKISINDIIDETGLSVCQYLFSNCEDEFIIMDVLDNTQDINKPGPMEYYPIHIACIYSNTKTINFMIEKCLEKVNFRCRDLLNNLPVHYMCKYQMIDRNINNYVTLEEFSMEQDNEGLCPLHIVAKYNNSYNNVKFFDVNHFNIPSQKGWYPLHYFCKYSRSDTELMKILDLNIFLNIETKCVKKYSAEDLIYKNKCLNKEQKRRVLQHYLNKVVVNCSNGESSYSINESSYNNMSIDYYEYCDIRNSISEPCTVYDSNESSDNSTNIRDDESINIASSFENVTNEEISLVHKIDDTKLVNDGEIDTNNGSNSLINIENGTAVESTNITSNIILDYSPPVNLNDIEFDFIELIDSPSKKV